MLGVQELGGLGDAKPHCERRCFGCDVGVELIQTACFCPRAGLHPECVPFVSVFTPRALFTKSKLRFV